MKWSTFLLGLVTGVVVVVAIVASCAGSGGSTCDLADCVAQCEAAGHAGGECRDGACYCTESSDADADGLDTSDGPDIGPDDTVVSEDVRPEDVRLDDGRDEETRREDADIPEGESETGEAKSSCDPMLCFVSCGGTCSDGVCVCEP